MQKQKNLAGIRGWLLFYASYSIVGVSINPYYIFKMIKEVLEWDLESVYAIGSYILLEVLFIISLFNLLKKNKNGPLITIITELVAILFEIIDFFLSDRTLYDVLDSALIIIVGMIWILYFRYSKRVNATF
ncbi:VanZ family protein [Paenibacillus sp. V4I9]|uniref:DUF2569 family protein n=1 Tax=Paenibacillus sp. V4I9 TaxID=3042308 RepID=UPI00278997EB|nr:DUF2569 family protein [Paenibacillus sp. V4I9]MDQ0888746.1 VanZ family protein [Paenibacillus sp. V4I9]